MSNVLMGLVGVVLFIGLAVAGSLYLGGRFSGVTNSSRATATLSQLSQVAQAINMFEMKTGTLFQAGTALSTLQPRFLKTTPTNPTGASPLLAVTSLTGSTGGGVNLILMRLDAQASEICTAIAEQSSGGVVPTVTTAADLPVRTSGCFRAAGTFGSVASGSHYAYTRSGSSPAVAAAPSAPNHTGPGCGSPVSGWAPSTTAGASKVGDYVYGDAQMIATALASCNSRMTGPGVCFITDYAAAPSIGIRTVWHTAATTTLVASAAPQAFAINCNAK